MVPAVGDGEGATHAFPEQVHPAAQGTSVSFVPSELHEWTVLFEQVICPGVQTLALAGMVAPQQTALATAGQFEQFEAEYLFKEAQLLYPK